MPENRMHGLMRRRRRKPLTYSTLNEHDEFRASLLINSAAMMILMPIFGISQGVQPIIGYNFGAK